MAMTMSIGVEFVLKDSFSAPATKIATAFTSLRQSVAGLPAMSGQFNAFSAQVEQGAGQMLTGKGGGGGKGGGLSAIGDVAGKLVTSFVALKGAAAGLDAFSAPLGSAREFGVQMGQIRTIADETVISTDAIRDATFGLAAAYGTDATTGAKSLYDTISAGITDASKATDLLGVANQFAVGGATDLAGGIDILTSSVNTYSAEGLTARQASDQLFVAIAAGKTTAGELAAKLGEVAPTAQAAGISFGELTGAIAALTLQGVKTPQAVAGLNAMISNIAKPSKDAADEARRLGIEWSLTALKGMGLQKFLGQLAGNTKVNVESFPKLFGSIDGIKSAFALTAQEGKKFNDVMGQMAHAEGATQKAFDVMSETSDFQAKRFDALKKNALTLIGESLEPLAAKALKLGSDLLAAFNGLPEPIRNGIVRFAAFAVVVGTAASAFLAFGAGLAAIYAQLAPLAASLGGILQVALPLLAVIAALVLAGAALKSAFEQNVGGIADYVAAKIEKVKLAFDALSQLFQSGEIRGDTVTKLIDPANAGVLDFVKGIYTAGNRLMNFFDGLKAGFEETVGASEGTFSRLMAAVDRLLDAFGLLFGALDPEAAKQAFDETGQSGFSFGQKVAGIALVVVDAITTLIDVVTGMVQAWHEVRAAISPIGDSFSAIGEAISELVGDFDSFGDSTDSNGQKAISFGQYVMGIFRVMADAVSSAIGVVKNIIVGLMNILGGAVEMWSGIIHGNWSQAWRGFARIVYGYVELVIGLLGSVVEAAASAVDAIGGIFGQDVGAARGIKRFKEDLLKDIKGGLGLDKPVEMQVLAKNAPAVADNQLFATNAALVEKMTAPEEQLFATNAAANVPPTSPAQAQAGVQAAGSEQVASGIEALRTEVSALGKRPVQVRSEVDLVLPDGQVLASTVADANASDSDLGYR